MNTAFVSYQTNVTKAANEHSPKMAAVLDQGLCRCRTNKAANAPKQIAAIVHEEILVSAPLTKYVAIICDTQ